MKNLNQNRAKEELLRFLETADRKKKVEPEFYKSGFKLLALLFAYKRKENGIHLRWNKQKAYQLASLTLEELKEKKRKDPQLNKIYQLLLDWSDLDPKRVEELLNLAAIRLDEIHKIQSTRASNIRINLLDGLIEGYVRINESISAEDVVSRLHADKGKGVVINIDNNQVIFKHEKKVKSDRTVAISGIGNRVTNARKKIRAEKQQQPK